MFNFEVTERADGVTIAVLQAEGINYGALYEVSFREAGVCAMVNQSRCDRFIDRFDYFLLDNGGKAVCKTCSAQFQG